MAVQNPAGDKYVFNFGPLDWSKGVKLLELYYDDTSNKITGGAEPIFYSKKDFTLFLAQKSLSSDFVQQSPSTFLGHSKVDFSIDSVAKVMVIGYMGSQIKITADGLPPTVVTTDNTTYTNAASIIKVQGLNKDYRIIINNTVVAKGTYAGISGHNEFLYTILKPLEGQLGGTFTSGFSNGLATYTLTSKAKQHLVIQMGEGLYNMMNAVNNMSFSFVNATTLVLAIVVKNFYTGATLETFNAAASTTTNKSYSDVSRVFFTVGANSTGQGATRNVTVVYDTVQSDSFAIADNTAAFSRRVPVATTASIPAGTKAVLVNVS